MTAETTPRRRADVRSIALNVGLTLWCGFAGLAYCSFGAGPATSQTGPLLLWLGCVATLLGLVTWLWWRHATPLALTLCAAGAAVALPLDASVALVGAVTLLHDRRGRSAWLGTAAAIAAAGWAFARDLLRPAAGSAIATILIQDSALRPHARLDWNVPLATAAFVAVTAGLVIGLGLFWRSRGELAASRRERREAEARNQALATDLARSTEREQIAREVHDALGHDLSLLSLQAASLELAENADPSLADSARAVRATAQEAHKSLSSLVDLLRHPQRAPDPHEHVAAAPGLGQLGELLSDATAHGMALTAVVMLADIDALDPTSGRALYRIVQESLTNARRHAPGAPVTLHLAGNEADGIRLSVTNPVTGAAPRGPGNGVTGMQERVALAGGSITAGPREDGQFGVDVWLPWRPAS